MQPGDLVRIQRPEVGYPHFIGKPGLVLSVVDLWRYEVMFDGKTYKLFENVLELVKE